MLHWAAELSPQVEVDAVALTVKTGVLAGAVVFVVAGTVTSMAGALVFVVAGTVTSMAGAVVIVVVTGGIRRCWWWGW